MKVSETFERVRALVARRDVRVSDHGFDELASDGILVREVLAGVEKAQVWRTTRSTPRVPVCSFSRRRRLPAPFMLSGASRRGRPRQRFLSQPTGLIRSGGLTISSAGETHEQAAQETSP